MHLSVGILAVLGLIAGASAETVKVEVGKSGSKTIFNPQSIKAEKGDVVEFHFNSQHSVVASDFENPCTPVSSGGFYSGTLPSGDKSTFSVTLNNTGPIFFYCSLPGHCQAGAVGVINQGSDDTVAEYQAAAAKTNSSKEPRSVFGGTVSDGSSSETTGTMASSAPSSTGTDSASRTSSTVASTGSSAAGHLGPLAGGSALALILSGLVAL
ncbi:Cupredoxin [Mariannaea sp. PMI_226]|nr:Cupredoxin [Mariannaea sp. PMI_226]